MHKRGGFGGTMRWLALIALLRSPASAADDTLPPPRELAPVEAEASGDLSLDRAIELLLQRNLDLRTKSQDLPKGRADILSAGLRNNPSVFFSTDNIPYGNYSSQRPGEVDYELTLIQPADVSGKRRQRLQVAQRAQRIIEALYQDAVRQEIDKLYTAYTDVLAGRVGVQIAQADGAIQKELVETIRPLVREGLRPRMELTQALVNQGRAETDLRKAKAQLLQSRRDLALLLSVPPEQADDLTPCGPLHDTAPPPPSVDELVRLALRIRPDLTAYRMNVERAQAQVRRTRAESIEDVILFYTPYQIQDFPGQQAQAAPGWEAGALIVLPVFDRKQGDLDRANVEVSQTQTEVRAVEQQVSNEVRQAATNYAVSRQSVERYESDILAGARRILEEKERLVASGQASKEALLAARKDYNDVVRQYQEILLRHRRAMLKLNTAVGQRILP